MQKYAEAIGSYDGLERQALSVIAGLTKGDITYSAGNLAKSTGMEPEGTTDFINAAVEHFTSQTENYISRKHNVSGSEVVEWASNALTPSEKASLFHHIYLGKTSVIDSLVAKYSKAVSIQRSRNRAA